MRGRTVGIGLSIALGVALASAGRAWLSRGAQNDAAPPASKPAQAAVAPDESKIDAPLLVEGARVFNERCSPCHGDRGKGDGVLAEVLPIRPRNYHEDAFKWGTSRRAIAETIRGGRSGVMPPFEDALSGEVMRAAAYLVWNWIPPSRRDED